VNTELVKTEQLPFQKLEPSSIPWEPKRVNEAAIAMVEFMFYNIKNVRAVQGSVMQARAVC
jgi:hypothetical protein